MDKEELFKTMTFDIETISKAIQALPIKGIAKFISAFSTQEKKVMTSDSRYHLKKVLILQGCEGINPEAYNKEGLLYYCESSCAWFVLNDYSDGGHPEDFELRNQGYQYSWMLSDDPGHYIENGELELYYTLEGEENV